jgi:uncharacterized protein
MSVVRIIAGLLAAMLLAISASMPARADLTFPAFSNIVVDEADVLPDEAERALIAKLKGFQDRSGHQFAVATVPSLQGTSVEDFGNQLFRAWKIGDAKRNDGVLLLVAPNERKVRIEVGYGLEGDLTDLVSGFIIRNAILPRFKAGDIPGGIDRGVDDVIAVFSGQADDYKARAAETADDEMPIETKIFLIVFCLIFFFIFIQAFRRGGRGGRRSSPWIVGGPGWGGGGGGGGFGGGFGGGGGGSSGGGGASGGW